MKNTIKLVTILCISLFITSCSKDDNIDVFEENLNVERFSNMEIGNSQLILPQSNIDIHIEFDYESTKKVTKIYFDAEPHNIPNVKEGELAWTLEDHLVPVERYEGQLNPHIHYHVYFDENDKYNPSFKAAEGIYKFKITVVHEDGTKSKITKDLHVIQKFRELEVGDNNVVTYGTQELHTEFEYVSGSNTVTNIKYELWFEEWRGGQNVEVGSWDKVITELPTELYQGVMNPHIHYHLDLIEGLPVGGYWLNIYVTEDGESEAVKLSVVFKVEE